jgi:hypothetical protein
MKDISKEIYVYEDSYTLAKQKALQAKENGIQEIDLVIPEGLSNEKDCIKTFITAFMKEAGYTVESLQVPNTYNLMKDQVEFEIETQVQKQRKANISRLRRH